MSRPILILGGIGYLILLGTALIWLHLSPIFILALTLGCIGFAVMILWPVTGVHAFIIVLYAEGVFAMGENLTGTKMVGAPILVGWMLGLLTRRSSKLRPHALFVVMGMFVLWCGILILYAYDDRAALGRTLTFLQLSLAAIMFSSVVDTPRKLRSIYWAVVIWTSVSTAGAIAEYYMGFTSQAAGLVGNRNQLALYITIAIICAYLVHQTSRHPLANLSLALTLPILFLGLALTLSRSGLIILAFALLLVFYRVAKERRVLIIAGSVSLLCLLTLVLPPAFWSRAETIVPSVQHQEGSVGIRVRLWKIGLKMVADNPITGVGPGNFVRVVPRYARGAMLKSHLGVHNSYLSVAAEMGIVGLAIFLLLHVLALKAVRRVTRVANGRGDKELVSLAVAAEACILVIMAFGLTGHLEYSKYLWIFFGLSVALARMSHQASSQTLAARQRHRPPVLEEGKAVLPATR